MADYGGVAGARSLRHRLLQSSTCAALPPRPPGGLIAA